MNDPKPVQPEPADLPDSSPSWERSTKIVIVVAILLLTALAAWRFQGLIMMTVTAAVIAFILNPLIVYVNQRTRIARGWVILIIYVILAIALVWLFVALGVAAFEQASDFIDLVPTLIDQLLDLIETVGQPSEPIIILNQFAIDPVQLPWDSITNQILSLVEPTLSTSGQFLGQLATRTIRLVGNFLFVFVLSIYLAVEFPHFGQHLDSVASQAGYSEDARRLSRRLGQIWDAFLRGQVILGVVIFIVVWLGLALIGVRNSLTLGLLSGLLEFIPTLGPVIGTGVAMIVAFFQPTNPWGLESWQFALVVLVFMVVVQQVENNILVPRIVGGALDLHPLIVLIGVLMGASLAGIIGAILAAPILASLKLIGLYTWRKLFDLEPFPPAEARAGPQKVEPSTAPDEPAAEANTDSAA
jgi:predicted PurR-regulated permease PerM